MNRRIVRTYTFTDREVAEALIQWMKSKDMPRPEYVASTPSTKWLRTVDGMTVEWTDEDEVCV